MTKTFNPKYIPALVEAKKNKPITETVSKLLRLVRCEDNDYEFGRQMGAPMDECGPLIYKAYLADAKSIVEEAGFLTLRIFYEIVRLRTSDKWLYNSGLCYFLDDED
jgi:hypothetical protein